MATQLDVIKAGVDNILLMQRIQLEWQFIFFRTWLPTAQISDEERKQHLKMIELVQEKLKEIDRPLSQQDSK